MKFAALTFVSAGLAIVIQTANGQSALNEYDQTSDNLFTEVAQAEMLAAKANNDDFLKRNVLYFAKRHRFVRINDEVLQEADRFTIQLFDDVAVTVEKRELRAHPTVLVWRGVIVDPVLSTKSPVRVFPSGEVLDEETALEVVERRLSVTIYAHLLPSSVTGPSTVGRSISLALRVPALKETFVVKSLKNDPLIHVVYEQDPDRCCFASLDTPLDPDDPYDAAKLEKGRAYQKYIDSLDAKERQRE